MYHKHCGHGSDTELIIFFTFFKVTPKSGVTTLEIDLRFLFDQFYLSMYLFTKNDESDLHNMWLFSYTNYCVSFEIRLI
jgi:hypothetical protein